MKWSVSRWDNFYYLILLERIQEFWLAKSCRRNHHIHLIAARKFGIMTPPWNIETIISRLMWLHGILKNDVAPYDVTLIYVTYVKIRNIWIINNKTNNKTINNIKTIIEFGSHRIWGIIKASVYVICLSLWLRTLALRFPHILLDLIK